MEPGAPAHSAHRPTLFYRFMHRVSMPLAAALWVHMVVEGRSNVPKHGPFIVVSNHVDNNDTYVIGRYVPGTVHYLARPSGIESRFLGRYWRAMEAIPADREGLLQALGFLRAGDVVGVYPDGVITQGMVQAKAGAALLAVRAGVPVVPVAIWGTEKVRIWPLPHGRRVRVHISFGCPRTLRRAEVRGRSLQELADDIMCDVAAMLPPSYRGYYADAVAHRADDRAPDIGV